LDLRRKYRRFTDRRCGICWFLIHNGFGNMAYMLSCGLPCLRRRGAQKEGFHNIFEEKREGANRNRQEVTLK
jgi:hypothetical protein